MGEARQATTGEQFPVFAGLGLIIGLPILVFLLSGAPVEFTPAKMGRFNLAGGITIIPEFLAILLSLVLYTASFIAEIVRAGIQAVNYGQTEASRALGLRHGITLRLVVIPQAMRIIIPPLTSQYLNLTKNSSWQLRLLIQILSQLLLELRLTKMDKHWRRSLSQ